MKFISKTKNYSITLRPGIPREPLTGRNAVPGLYVRFDDHVANVIDPMVIELLKDSSVYHIDFESADSIEPGFVKKDADVLYTHKTLKHGSIESSVNAPHPIDIAAEIEKRAIEIAKQIAPKIASDMIKAMQADNKKESVSQTDAEPSEVETLEKPMAEVPRRGRPKKEKTE